MLNDKICSAHLRKPYLPIIASYVLQQKEGKLFQEQYKSGEGFYHKPESLPFTLLFLAVTRHEQKYDKSSDRHITLAVLPAKDSI